MASTPGLEGIEAIVFRTVGDQVSLWESLLPDEVLRLPEELARVDVLLVDPAFFAPFVPLFDPRMGQRKRERAPRLLVHSATRLATAAGFLAGPVQACARAGHPDPRRARRPGVLHRRCGKPGGFGLYLQRQR